MPPPQILQRQKSSDKIGLMLTKSANGLTSPFCAGTSCLIQKKITLRQLQNEEKLPTKSILQTY